MITSVFRSSDGKRILYAADGILHIVDASTEVEQGTVAVGGSDIVNIFFSADGRLAAPVPGHGQIPVINLDTRQVIAQLDGQEIGVDIHFTPDDRYAVSAITWIVSGGSETDVEVWDLPQGKLLTTITAPNERGGVFLSQLVMSSDGKWVAAGGSDDNVYVWSIPQGELVQTLRGHVGIVRTVALSPDGRLLASAGDDGIVRLWNPAAGRLIRSVAGLATAVTNLHFSASGSQLLIDEYGAQTQALTLATLQLKPAPGVEATPDQFAGRLGQEGFGFGAIYNQENPVAFSPDGKSLFSGSYILMNWSLAATATPAVVKSLPGYADKLTYSTDGQRLAAITEGGALRVWDVLSNSFVFSATQQAKINAALSSDGKRIVLDQGDGLAIWAVDDGAKIVDLNNGKTDQDKLVAFSADGAQVYSVTTGQSVVDVWDAATGVRSRQITLPSQDAGPFNAAAIHWPWLAGGKGASTQFSYELLNLETGQLLKLPVSANASGTQPLHFSPDGRLLIGLVSDPDQLLVWRTDTGQQLFGGTLSAGFTAGSDADISPDSKTLALGHDGKVDLWDISSLDAAAHAPAGPVLPSPTPFPTAPGGGSPTGTPFPSVPLTPAAVPTLTADAISPDNAGGVAEIAHFGQGTLAQARWSRDGQTIAAAGALGVYVYSSQDLSETAVYSSAIPLVGVAQQPNGDWVVAGRLSGHIQVWDATMGQVITNFPGYGLPILSVDGSRLADNHFSDGLLDLTVRRRGPALHTDPYGQPLAALSPNGRIAAQVQSVDSKSENSIRVWDADTGRIIDALGGPTQNITALAFGPDGRRLAAAAGGAAWLWTIQSSAPPQSYTVFSDAVADVTAPRQVTAIDLNPDDTLLAAGTSERDVWLFDRQTHAVRARLQGLAASIAEVQFSPDGQRLLGLDADGTMAVWTVADGHLQHMAADHAGPIRGLVFRDDGDLTTWDNNTSWVLDPSDAAPLQTVSIYSGTIIAASPDGAQLAVYRPYRLSLWDARSGALQWTLPVDIQETEVGYYPIRTLYGAVYSGDSQRLAYFGTGGAWIYDAANGTLVQHFEANAPNLAAFSPDQTHIAVCYDRLYCEPSIWDLKTGAQSLSLDGNTDYFSEVQSTYTPDGLRVAAITSGSQDEFTLWDASTGRQLAQSPWPQASLTSLALSPDGRLAALGQSDGRIALLDLSTLKVVAQLAGDGWSVSHLAFSRDGRYLASAGDRGVVHMWGLLVNGLRR